MMNIEQKIDKIYQAYQSADFTITRFRTKGAVYRHLLSLPYRLSRAIHCRRILSLINKYDEVSPLSPTPNAPIVSLTSFPQRINSVHLTIESMFRQHYKPQRIVLWLSNEEFSGTDIPDNLKRLIGKGLDVRFVDDNIRSHKKYYYALQEFSDNIVITIDDDLYYPSDTIDRLMSMHKAFPDTICSNAARCMTFSDKDNFNEYRKWPNLTEQPAKPSILFTALGFSGILYPANCFDKQLFDIDFIKENCPYADDLWLKGNELRMNIKVTSGPIFVHPVTIPNTQQHGLQHINMGHQNMNNQQWQNITKFLNLKPEHIED